MEPAFLTAIHIEKVRHLKDIDIPLSPSERKNLIFTGKNGSGKTSILDNLASYLQATVSGPKHETISEVVVGCRLPVLFTVAETVQRRPARSGLL